MAVDIKKALLEKLPPITWQNTTHFERGTNYNIIETLLQAAPKAVEQAKPIAQYFKGATDRESLQKIHTFIRSNLGYRRDPKKVQQIKMPNRFINESGDCKSNALFIYAIAKNLGIPIDFRFANYQRFQGKIPSHVYNVAFDKKSNSFVYIDGTSSKFGVEAKKPNYVKNGGLMRIQTLSDNMTIEGKGKLKAKAQEVKRKVQAKSQAVKAKAKAVVKKAATNVKNAKLGQKIKGAAATGPRIAFLGLLKLNFRGMATKLKAKQGPALQKKWISLGGSYPELQKSINAGAAKKPLLGINTEIGSATVAAAAVTAATPIILALSSFLGKLDEAKAAGASLKAAPAVKRLGAALAKNKTLIKQAKQLGTAGKKKLVDQLAKQTGTTPEQAAAVLNEAAQSAGGSGGDSTGASTPEEKEKFAGDPLPAQSDNKKFMILGGLGLLAAGAAYAMSKK